MRTGSTLLVVAGGAVGRFFIREPACAEFVEIEELRLQVTDGEGKRERAPHVHDRLGQRQRKIENRQPAHAKVEEKFLLDVLRRTIDVFRAEGCVSLVLCAPPKALRFLKRELTADLQQHLSYSLGEDITAETAAAIGQRLDHLLQGL